MKKVLLDNWYFIYQNKCFCQDTTKETKIAGQPSADMQKRITVTILINQPIIIGLVLFTAITKQ